MTELLRDLWYFAALSREVRTGKLVRKLLLNEPIVLGRDQTGTAFALRDICPHRAAPLSAGRMVDEGGVETVECPYHGWRFRTDGACAAIPSLAEGQGLDSTRIRVQRFFAHEQAGLIWLYIPSNPRAEAPAIPPPDFAELAVGGAPKLVDRMVFAAHVDHAVVGLMDPAHGPYVHAQWWWRGRHDLRAKEKKFEPRDMGFSMVRHAPSGNSYAYKVLGGVPSTEITFRLPCIRWEDIRAGNRRVLALTSAAESGQADCRRCRARVSAAGRDDGKPAERRPRARSGAALDRRQRYAGQMVSQAQTRMDRQPRREPCVREPT
jgi:phenylpropionate dioxygenase-like ring-hydroxylating dioxygenase large terminal subunit